RRRLLSLGRGVDLDRFQPAPRDPDGFRVMYAGRLSYQKGIPDLLAGYDLFARDCEAELILVGQPMREIYRFLEQKNTSVRVVGAVPQFDLVSHYHRSSVFVLMSVQDGFGMVMLQAMASGLP